MQLNAHIPPGPIEQKWDSHLEHIRLVGPRNRALYKVIVVGTGLAGASAASSIAAMGYSVDCFCFQDSPRRAHSIAAQGGINAAKNYHEDGDSIFRLFHDTQKGGDYRAREANVWRLAQLSSNIIDQATAQGVPFAREYGGLLANRSFGGVLVERTFYCRGETGQQLLLGANSALAKEIHNGQVQMHTRSELLDIVVVDGRSRGIPMCFTYRPMHSVVMLRQPGARINTVPDLLILVTHRFIQPVFPVQASTNPSSH